MTSVIYTDNPKCVSTAHIFVPIPKPLCPTAYYCSSPFDYLMSTSTQISTIKFMILSTDLFIFWSSVSVNGTTTYSAVSHALLRVSLTTSLVTFMYPLFPQKYHILVYIHHVVSELLRIPQVSI